MSDPIRALEEVKQQARSWIAAAAEPREAIRRAGRLFAAAVGFKKFAAELRALTVSVTRETRKGDLAQKDMAAELGVNPQRISQLKAKGDALAAAKEDQ